MAKDMLIARVLERRDDALLEGWLEALRSSESFRREMIGERDLGRYCSQFLSLLREAVAEGEVRDIRADSWAPLREHLSATSAAWRELGFEPSRATEFVMLFKRPLLTEVGGDLADRPRDLIQEIGLINDLFDRLGLWSAEEFQRRQAGVIERQQIELMELSTPVITLWEGVLALPLIGTLDSARTQVVMESLLERIVEHSADVAILDITGVPTVDTMVAQHLIKAVTAARLMGTECIVSGIRPGIAQTMVQLGVDLRDVTTKSTLADAFTVALTLRGQRVTSAPASSPSR